MKRLPCLEDPFTMEPVSLNFLRPLGGVMFSEAEGEAKDGYQGLILKRCHLCPERRRRHDYTELEDMVVPLSSTC